MIHSFDTATLDYREGFLTPEEAQLLYTELLETTQWQQENIILFGKSHRQPRLTAWYGRGMSAVSRYRSETPAQTWTARLRELKARIEAAAAPCAPFNALLLNYYRHGQDSVGWHADDEPCLGPQPTIASLSLGATRRFRLKEKGTGGKKLSMDLADGSLLIMRGTLQRDFVHSVPKTTRSVGPRLNLTFRALIDREH